MYTTVCILGFEAYRLPPTEGQTEQQPRALHHEGTRFLSPFRDTDSNFTYG